LQRAALTTKTALESADVLTSARDMPSGVDSPVEPRGNWLGLEVYPITIINVSPVPYFEVCYCRSGLARRDNVFRIAYWYWELDRIPHEWSRFAPLIDEIWAPTPFVAQAMRAMTVPVYEMPPGVLLSKAEPIAREALGIPTGHFVFLFLFDMCSDFTRKNPLAVIRAFRLAFSPDEPAVLVIKVARGYIDPVKLERLHVAGRQNKVLVIDRLMSPNETDGFIAMCDCFVSRHRAEGFSLGLAGAMLMGKAGYRHKLLRQPRVYESRERLLVDFEMVEIAENGYVYKKGFRWAEPSEAHAAELMRSVFENRHEHAVRAERAKKGIAEQFSVEKAGQRMERRLKEIRNRDTARAR
jgi:hypothetical protein